MTQPKEPEDRWQTILKIWGDNRWLFGIAGLLVGLTIGVLIGLGIADESNTVLTFIDGIWPEVISTLFAIAVIQQLTQRSAKRAAEEAEKRDLILQMGSPDNGFAREAVRKLRVRGWVDDGSLNKGKFQDCDLSGAKLSNASLCNANFDSAKLERTSFEDADLTYVTLYDAKLNGADLRGSILIGADFRQADLTNASLCFATLDFPDLSFIPVFRPDTAASFHAAIMPNGQPLSSDNPIERYTDDRHPDFWEPDWVKEERKREQEDLEVGW